MIELPLPDGVTRQLVATSHGPMQVLCGQPQGQSRAPDVLMASGFFGLALQQFLPRMMTNEFPREAIYEQIPYLRTQLLARAQAIGEILVKPRERQDLDLCKEYERAIIATALVLPFDLPAARRFSELRLNRTLRALDAIQLSCAATVDTDLFVTNDSRLSGIRIDGVQFIVSLDRIPF